MKKRSFCLVGHCLMGLAIIAGFSAAVMLLWNALIPTIFGVISINFWQALGLLVLCRMLFGGFGSKHFMGMGMKRHHHHGRNAMREKWMNMTPEERQDFVNKRHHCGGFEASFRATVSEKEQVKENE